MKNPLTDFALKIIYACICVLLLAAFLAVCYTKIIETGYVHF
jgi:hypothetical protein